MYSSQFSKEDLTNSRFSILKLVNIHPTTTEITLKPEIFNIITENDDLHKYLLGVVKTIPNHDNPSKLSDFNYEFRNNKLVNIDTGKAFHWVNQSHYDALGDTIVEHIQDILVKEYNLIQVFLPLSDPIDSFLSSSNKNDNNKNDSTTTINQDSPTSHDSPNTNDKEKDGDKVDENTKHMIIDEIQKEETKKDEIQKDEIKKDEIKKDEIKKPKGNNIFVSDNVLTCSTLLLLIQGAGAVRAGQWARALCINEDLSIGTIFPYLKKAQEQGWGIIVFNPNLNEEVPAGSSTVTEVKREWFLTLEKILRKRGDTKKIVGSENYIQHGKYIWENIIKKSKASTILSVAHSRGGDNIVQLLKHYHKEFYEKVAAIAFTDSVHSIDYDEEDFVISFLKDRCCNWVTSLLPLNAVVSTPKRDCLRVSAGHNQHEYTSGTSITAVFEFLVDKLTKFRQDDKNDKKLDNTGQSEQKD